MLLSYPYIPFIPVKNDLVLNHSFLRKSASNIDLEFGYTHGMCHLYFMAPVAQSPTGHYRYADNAAGREAGAPLPARTPAYPG